MYKYLLFILFCVSPVLKAQELNKIVIDEKSEKPMLIGYSDRTAFQDTNFAWWFNSEYNNYKVDTIQIGCIRDLVNNYKIVIVMGTWCSDSRREVPRLYKILDELNFSEENIDVINVNRKKEGLADEVKNLDIELVPTIIFYLNDEEVGRIIETPETTLERDMKEIL